MPLLEDIVREYYSQIPSALDTSAAGDATSWSVNCDEIMPDLEFSFSPNSAAAGSISGIQLVNYSSNTNGVCQAYLYASTGQTFSRSFFTSNYVALDFAQGASGVGVGAKAAQEVIPTGL